MSEENVEIVRSAYDVPYGGDEWLGRVEKFVAADCEVEDRTLPGVARGLKGPEAMRAEAAHMREAFEDVSYTVEDLVDLDDRVLVRVRGSGRGRGSGIRIDGTLGHLLRLHAGKVVRFDVYGTWEEALEAAGLSE
jgi:ketosteroid isomerase-like protein